MFAKTFGATTLGIDGMLIEVEADVTNGLPKFEIVGLADIAVKEARRARSCRCTKCRCHFSAEAHYGKSCTGRFAQERLQCSICR